MTTALYRRYRPDSFADVIGQEHVTDPLRAALRSGRVTHAYLFSGPRGCGKTTSARILARCLNCAEGPTDTPCGVCDSCVELATGGPGSLDVVEIDAASHGGVDDARDLRERAVFAPARDRYKVFIIDEAHMVTPQGFNALLKLVEEPPAHVKFVFATTEPDKVIGTIRSRTHHYPFRLVPPAVLTEYLAQLCEREGIQVDAGVLPLVVRAGGGSVRDSLSVLDQLLAGAEDGRVAYPRAAALLGFTPSSLLDDVVSALAAGDGAGVFRVVENVVESGQDPRRFIEDLLDRLRDLIVLAASGDAADAVLRALPADELDRMRPQARALGAQRLSTLADLVNTGLTEMVGATSPRLQLELVLARALVTLGAFGAAPVPEVVAASTGAVAASDDGPRSRPVPAGHTSPSSPVRPEATPSPSPGQEPATPAPSAAPQPPATPAPAAQAPAPQTSGTARGGRAAAGPAEPARTPTAERPTPEDPAPAGGRPHGGTTPPSPEPVSTPSAPTSGIDGNELRRRWPEILGLVANLSRVAWMTARDSAQVAAVSGDTLTLRFESPGPANAFVGSGGPDFVSRAVYETVGAQLQVVVEIGGPPEGGSGSPTPADAGRPAAAPSRAGAPAPARQGERQGRGDDGGWSAREPGQAHETSSAHEPGPAHESSHAPESGPANETPVAVAPSGPAGAPAAVAQTISEPRSEAVARALADWEGTPMPAPAEPVPAQVPEPAATATTGAAVESAAPHGEASVRVVPARSDHDDEPPLPPEPPREEDLAPPPTAERSLPPVIDLAARQLARAEQTAPASQPGPAPWEDDDGLEAEIEGSVEVADGGAMIGVALVAKMLGGVVIDEIVENTSDGRMRP